MSGVRDRTVTGDTAVVLMAYGSPSRLEDVPAYFEDIRGGRPARQEAVDELVARYRRLGISPLNEITEAQRAGLEQELGVPVFVGMKHWQPRIADAVDEALARGATKVVGLVLAPHYSGISIGGYRDRLEAALDGRAELHMIESWHDHPPYLDALAERVRGTDAHVVFTAHSLPARILENGDPIATSSSRRHDSLQSAPASKTGRSPSRARVRPASPGSGRTSWTSCRRFTIAASPRSWSHRSASYPTILRSSGTSMWKPGRKLPNSGWSSTASSR